MKQGVYFIKGEIKGYKANGKCIVIKKIDNISKDFAVLFKEDLNFVNLIKVLIYED